jgi:hypothetical protein
VVTGRDALAGLRILLVEDEILVAMLVEEMLHVASGGQERGMTM